jgi:diacylglycerol kinase (ATP)
LNGLFFIINPTAGHGRAGKVWKKVKKELERKKISYRSFFTEYAGHAEVLARQVATIQNYHLNTIIVVGGEGTMYEVVNGLSSFNNIQIGFIRAGNGNDFLRGVKLRAQPVKTIRSILQRLKQPVKPDDLGVFRLEGKKSSYFTESIGIGLDAEVVKVLEEIPLKNLMTMLHMNYFTLIIAFFKVFFRYQPSDLQVNVDGGMTTYTNVWFITTSATPDHYGKMKGATNEDSTDGNLDVTIVRNINRMQLFMLLTFHSIGKRLKSGAIETFRCKAIKVHSEIPLFVQADGEIVGEVPVTISVRKSHIALLK